VKEPKTDHVIARSQSTTPHIELANENLAVPARLELATFGLGNRCSILLSYGTNELILLHF
jgi:hypothetical protein